MASRSRKRDWRSSRKARLHEELAPQVVPASALASRADRPLEGIRSFFHEAVRPFPTGPSGSSRSGRLPARVWASSSSGFRKVTSAKDAAEARKASSARSPESSSPRRCRIVPRSKARSSTRGSIFTARSSCTLASVRGREGRALVFEGRPMGQGHAPFAAGLGRVLVLLEFHRLRVTLAGRVQEGARLVPVRRAQGAVHHGSRPFALHEARIAFECRGPFECTVGGLQHPLSPRSLLDPRQSGERDPPTR